jgi:hypothetical protein
VVHRDKLKVYYSSEIENQEKTRNKPERPNEPEEYDDSGEIVPQPVLENEEALSDRPRRMNRQKPAYLQQFVCSRVIAGSEMASRTVEIPSGQPYCFLCHTSFRSAYSLNRHNAANREKHQDMQASLDALRTASTAGRNSSDAAIVIDRSPAPDTSQVRAIRVATKKSSVTSAPVPSNTCRDITEMIINLLDDERCCSVDDAVQCLVSEDIAPDEAELSVRVALGVARHVAGLHAAHLQINEAPRNTRRIQMLHKLSDSFARYLMGLPETIDVPQDTPDQLPEHIEASTQMAIEDFRGQADIQGSQCTADENSTLDKRITEAREWLPMDETDHDSDMESDAAIDVMDEDDPSPSGINDPAPGQSNAGQTEVITHEDSHAAKEDKLEKYRSQGFAVKKVQASVRPPSNDRNSAVRPSQEAVSTIAEFQPLQSTSSRHSRTFANDVQGDGSSCARTDGRVIKTSKKSQIGALPEPAHVAHWPMTDIQAPPPSVFTSDHQVAAQKNASLKPRDAVNEADTRHRSASPVRHQHASGGHRQAGRRVLESPFNRCAAARRRNDWSRSYGQPTRYSADWARAYRGPRK